MYTKVLRHGWRLTLWGAAFPLFLIGAVLFASFGRDAGEAVQHILSTMLVEVSVNTILLMAGVVILTAVMGVGSAWLTSTYSFPGRKLFDWLLMLPMAIPAYVSAFVYIAFFDFSGPVQTYLRDAGWSGFVEVRNLTGLIIVMSLCLYPYVFIMAKGGFLSEGRRAAEAARILGCSAPFWRVSLPMARPWIAGGLLLVAMETMADFGAVSIFNIDTYSTAIYKAWFGFFSLDAAAQLSTAVLGVVFLLVAMEHASRKRRKYYAGEKSSAPAPRIPLHGAQKWGAFSFCLLLFSVAFLLPAGVLAVWASGAVENYELTSFLPFAGNSLILSAVAAVATVGAGFLVAYGSRRVPVAWLAPKVATLGYALPGTVLAVGLFIPVAAFDNIVMDLFGAKLGLDGQILKGTLLVLIAGYVIRFISIAQSASAGALSRMKPSVEEASRVLGRGPLRTIATVVLPVVKGGLFSGALLVFVDVMKEMPVTLMMRPFGWDTLAVKVFEYTSEGEWQKAAIPSLLLIITGLVPVVILGRSAAKGKK